VTPSRRAFPIATRTRDTPLLLSYTPATEGRQFSDNKVPPRPSPVYTSHTLISQTPSPSTSHDSSLPLSVRPPPQPVATRYELARRVTAAKRQLAQRRKVKGTCVHALTCTSPAHARQRASKQAGPTKALPKVRGRGVGSLEAVPRCKPARGRLGRGACGVAGSCRSVVYSRVGVRSLVVGLLGGSFGM
jgi:hypothetical protein